MLPTGPRHRRDALTEKNKSSVELVLFVIITLLLAWVGITTHQTQVELQRVSTTLELFAASTSGAIRRLDGELRDFDPRLRAVEWEAARRARISEFSTTTQPRDSAENPVAPRQ